MSLSLLCGTQIIQEIVPHFPESMKFAEEKEITKTKTIIKTALEHLGLLPAVRASDPAERQKDVNNLEKQLFIQLSPNFETHALRLALAEKTYLVYEHLIRHKLFYHEKSDLHFLVEEENIEEINEFFASLPTDPLLLSDLLKIQDKDGNTVLHWASIRGNKDLVSAILDKISNEQLFELLKIQNKVGKTVLYWAVRRNDRDLILTIINNLSKDQLFELLKNQHNDETVLHWAARRNDKDLILTIIKKLSIDQLFELLKIQDHAGKTVLHRAKTRDDNLVSTIIEKISNERLFELLKIEDKDIISAILDKISNDRLFELLKIQNEDGYTLLHSVVININKDIVLANLHKISDKQLFELLKILDKNGNTVFLHWVATIMDNKDLDSLDIVYKIINKISDPNLLFELLKIQNVFGNTVLHWAVGNNNKALISAIVNKISNKQLSELLKIRDNDGNTVLDLAVLFDKKVLVFLLATVNKIRCTIL